MTVRCGMALLLWAAAGAAGAQEPADALKAIGVDGLKALYLACDRAAMCGRLAAPEIAQCSVVYEALKQRAFGGDFDRLLAWSRARPPLQHSARDGGRPASGCWPPGG